MTDTGTIFEHGDSDGDGFVLWEDGGGRLDLQRFGSNPYCDMAPADVRRLHSVLGQWLTKNGVPAEDVNPFAKPAPSVGGDDMLRKVVREEILEALLLLKATAGDYDGYETPELDARAYNAIATVAERAASSWKDNR